jgi:hypothetical protein
MKRKIAIMLAAVMTTAMLPMDVMAASSNSVNKIDSVKNDDIIQGVQLKIEPKAAVESGSSIIINIENGEFDEDKIDFGALAYSAGAKSYEEVKADLDKLGSDPTENAIARVLASCMNTSAPTDQIPYKLKVISDTELQVFLAPLPSLAVDTSGTIVSNGKPYYLIPIKAKATSKSEDVKISIDDNGTSISSTTHTVAKTSSDKGSTTTTVSKIATGTDDIKIEKITVKESVKDTFEEGKVKVRLNGGFKISPKSKIKVSAGVNLPDGEITDVEIADNDSYFTFTIPAAWTGTKLASSFNIEGLVVEADDDDKNWGDINVTISGSNANITKETVKVGERVDYGFEMTVTDEVPTIISGRTHLANDDLDEDEFKSATVSFKETAQDTWIGSRKLEFTLPDGVKIVDVEYDEVERIESESTGSVDQNALEENTVISGKGSVLKINKGLYPDYGSEKTDGIEFEMNLILSIDADFTGDVTLAVAGAGIAADTLEDVTIATAVAPISVSTTTTSVNMGYQVFDGADITITEAQDGVLLDGEEVKISFDDKKFGNSELGFNDTDVEYTVDGELEIKHFEVNDGAITFEVDKTSYSEPASITISNVTVGTTRSVPYGSYDLKIGGEAVVNNYKDKIDDVYDLKFDNIEDTKDNGKEVNEDRAYFDTTDGYSFDDYVKIVTDTNTLDGVVEVTIGEKTIVMDGESVDMDVAAYIQTSSNSTMVPLRFVTLALGVDQDKVTDADNSSKISWDGNSKTATILYAAGNGQKIIQFQAGSNIMVVDGTSIPMENGVVAEITDSRMFVPFRALGQALGVPVDWDAETRTAIYNKR